MIWYDKVFLANTREKSEKPVNFRYRGIIIFIVNCGKYIFEKKNQRKKAILQIYEHQYLYEFYIYANVRKKRNENRIILA